MSIKLVEYVHEYDEEDWYWSKDDVSHDVPLIKSKRVTYVSHVTETHYAVRTPEYMCTDETGSNQDYGVSTNPWHIDGSSLSVYSREDINGLIGLLEKLRDQEFPAREIETFGD